MRRRWAIFGVCGLIGVIPALFLLTTSSNERERKAVEKTKRELRQQGFKVELSDFNFSISPEMRVRTRALTNAFFKSRAYRGNLRSMGPFPGLMLPVGTNSAAVIWKDDKLEDYIHPYELMQFRDKDHWTEVRRDLDDDRILLNEACAAALAGPIRFELNAQAGFAMMLGHLPSLKDLTQRLALRALLDLRDQNKDAAWTNLLALTRLVTACEPEPVEVSQIAHCGCAVNAYNATWQVLQASGWTDEQLSALQREWESTDFLKSWPETAAFERASAVDAYHRERKEPVPRNFSLQEIVRAPRYAWSGLVSYRQRLKYRSLGTYEDEVGSMLHYREREVQLKRAVQAATWLEMRNLPVVTNHGGFVSSNASATQCLLNNRSLSLAWAGQGQRPLARPVEAEARRRIIVTAIALERYRALCGAYPRTLEELAPKFLNKLLPDFMDGKPLRYLATSDGKFVLYSVGLDCADNGGAVPRRGTGGNPNEDFGGLPDGGHQPTDIVWPRAASRAEVDAQKSEDKRAAEEQIKQAEIKRAEWERDKEVEKLATVHRLLTIGQPSESEPNYRGHPISEVLQKGKKGPKLKLEELLTLRPIITGEEPSIATFEVPMSYDTVSNIGGLHLMLDGEEKHDCDRSTNGYCLLSWNTTFDPPGPHAVQAEFTYTDRGKEWNRITLRGPVRPYFSSNICQFDNFYSQYVESHATLYAKLPESNGYYAIELKSPKGELVKTFTGSTSNGVIDVRWDLKDEHGKAYTGRSFDTVYHVTLPDSARSQTMKGP